MNTVTPLADLTKTPMPLGARFRTRPSPDDGVPVVGSYVRALLARPEQAHLPLPELAKTALLERGNKLIQRLFWDDEANMLKPQYTRALIDWLKDNNNKDKEYYIASAIVDRLAEDNPSLRNSSDTMRDSHFKPEDVTKLAQNAYINGFNAHDPQDCRNLLIEILKYKDNNIANDALNKFFALYNFRLQYPIKVNPTQSS